MRRLYAATLVLLVFAALSAAPARSQTTRGEPSPEAAENGDRRGSVEGQPPPETVEGDTISPQHTVICVVTAQTPYRSTVTYRVIGRAIRECSGASDVANFTVQLQRWDGDSWNDWGRPATTSSTASYVSIYDSVNCPQSGYFRTRAHEEGFHGTWTEVDDVSPYSFLAC